MVPQDMKNYFGGSSMEERLDNTNFGIGGVEPFVFCDHVKYI
jgi:hypothetical protein